MALSQAEIIERAWKYGHFRNPVYPDTHNVNKADLQNLTLNDPVVKQAIASYQEFQSDQLDAFTFYHHARRSQPDGEVGAATVDLLETRRCGHPDYGMLNAAGEFDPEVGVPAVGDGNWPRCHNIGEYHAAVVRVDESGMPSFLRPLFDRVKSNVVKSYEKIGLRWIFDNNHPNPNINFSFVGSSSGWIGLAIIGRNQRCNSNIWCRYLASYRGGSTEAQIENQWTSLIKHELGHNTGLEHSRGGVMNPSIIPGLPLYWDNDPSEAMLKRWFGGEPIPGSPEPEPPGPGPGPIPPGNRITATARITVPPGFTPGTYDFNLTPEITV